MGFIAVNLICSWGPLLFAEGHVNNYIFDISDIRDNHYIQDYVKDNDKMIEWGSKNYIKMIPIVNYFKLFTRNCLVDHCNRQFVYIFTQVFLATLISLS